MKRKYFTFLIAFIASMHILINRQYSSANTYITTTCSYNDAQYEDSSTGAPSVDSKASFNAGGWSVYRVYYGQGSYGTGFTYNASLIEIDLSQIPKNDTIENAILHINVINVIQKYNYDSKLAILSHLRSTGYTGDAESDYWHIDGPSPVVDTLYYFYLGSSNGWKEIDVTLQVIDNLNAGIDWAVFWLSPAPWENPEQIIGEAKGVSVASADYTAGSLAPYLEIHTTSYCEGDFDTDGDVDGSDLALFAADFGRTDCDTGGECEGDFDKDGDVDGSDLAVFAADFGRTDCPH